MYGENKECLFKAYAIHERGRLQRERTWEGERERERVCVCERERECVCVSESERERERLIDGQSRSDSRST